MSYYAKDCLFMFFIGLPFFIFFKQGIWVWAVICFARYLLIKKKWKDVESNCCHTKAEFEAKGYTNVPENWFDENGVYHPENTPFYDPNKKKK